MGRAINLFNHRLQISIREGQTDLGDLTTILSTLTHLDPFQTMDTGKFCLVWIDEILSSGYWEDERYKLASRVVLLLGNHLYSKVPESFHYLEPDSIPPLLGFLLLCERFYTTESTPYPGFIALRILSDSPKGTDIGTTIFPILASTLLLTHPLRARSLALEVFCKLMSGWFSLRMDDVLDQDLDKLLQAVGDPFQFTSHIPLQDGQPAFTSNYKPMMAAVVLIEFASSDL